MMRFLRSARAVLWGVALAAALAAAFPDVTAAATAPPPLHGASAAILDASTGKILYEIHGARRYPMASTTKMMTALVALRLLGDHPGRVLVVPPQVSQAYGTTLHLQPGTQYTFGQLLEGMLLPSANDAAIAVAVAAAGSLPRFVALMNAEASRLGLVDTHYANPDGLESPDHYSSAVDLARLGQVVMGDPLFRQTVGMTQATIPWPGHTPDTRVIGSINELLSVFPGADGIKTGYTSQALNVAVGEVQRQGRSVIAVVMGESRWSLWPDEEALLRYGLAITPAAPVRPSAATLVTTPPGEITAHIVPARHSAPVAAAGAALVSWSPWRLLEWTAGLPLSVVVVAFAVRWWARPRRRVPRLARF